MIGCGSIDVGRLLSTLLFCLPHLCKRVRLLSGLKYLLEGCSATDADDFFGPFVAQRALRRGDLRRRSELHSGEVTEGRRENALWKHGAPPLGPLAVRGSGRERLVRINLRVAYLGLSGMVFSGLQQVKYPLS